MSEWHRMTIQSEKFRSVLCHKNKWCRKKSRAMALLRNFLSFLVILSCRSHSLDDWEWRDGQGWRNSIGLKPSPSHSVILESVQDDSRMTGGTGMGAIRIYSDFFSRQFTQKSLDWCCLIRTNNAEWCQNDIEWQITQKSLDWCCRIGTNDVEWCQNDKNDNSLRKILIC
jgi:hypothetical protein